MWLKGIAQYDGGLAHYNMQQENEGIYQANLTQFDGKPGHQPPQRIILIRGRKGWTGNIKDKKLIRDLGSIIDVRTRGRLFSKVVEENMSHYRKL
jgi:hypothetical protein